ncbi:response regulator [Yoonia sediminilitoris]|uniref:CheY-like chemotaxis protein n=1 Tax=Yoonia sediminilitoris TaxID=1286148 RepID=A0A2T6KI99_9RHOB|nr:response regulator [Yoonia sediminilitoris]PUB15456.1 CheY-like chemotaxis protein [Yoonia sediminilitoris]RCW96066.1 CheY-like chemotaxis protein [Yoonia sediminilitoris]
MKEEMNILLVEDNDLDVEILRRGLKRLGASNSLVRARDGVEALEILKENQTRGILPDPFVILLDINMPRMNGHEFLVALRECSDLKSARVFVFKTSDSKEDVNKAYDNNANGYIVKPNSSSELNDVIQSLRSSWRICETPRCTAGRAPVT